MTFAKNIQFAWVFRAVALILLFQAGQMSLLGILQVNRDFRTQGLIQAGAVAASAAGMLVVYLTHGGIVQVIAVLVSAAALNSVMLWAWSLRAANAVFAPGWIRMRVAPFDGLGREMTRFAILGNLRGTIQSVMADGDLLILGYFRNPTEVAYFKLAKSIVQIAALTNQPLVGASYPEFASAVATKSWAQFRSLMRRGSKVAAAWVVPVSLGLLLLARPAIATLYGPSFLPATPILALLLVGVAVDGTLFWTSAALLSLGEPGFVAGAAFWATVGKLGLALLLVPVGGGVALAALQSVGLVGINAASAWRTSVSLRIREALVDA